VTLTPSRARGHVPTLLQMTGHGDTESKKNKNKKVISCTDHTEALTKTTDCTCKAKKVEGHDKNFPALRA